MSCRVHTPGVLYRCASKGVAERGICKTLKINGKEIDRHRDTKPLGVRWTPPPRVFCKRLCELLKRKEGSCKKSVKSGERVCKSMRTMNLPQRSQRAQRKAEGADRYPTRQSFCVNALSKGVTARFGVKAVDKGLNGRGGCENRFSLGERAGRNGDTVTRTLTKAYRISGYLSSDKLKAVD
jgi:hypothetical protein